MIPEKLKTIFFISIPVFIAHGLEEYFTGFYKIDLSYRYLFGCISDLPVVFLIYQILLWLLLIIVYCLLGKSWIKWILILVGITYVGELQHLIMTIILKQYYPGAITSIAISIIGCIFLKELLKNFRQNYEN